jgi:hypothetical protein
VRVTDPEDITLDRATSPVSTNARLEAEHPGWRIRHVPNSHSGTVTWCVQPLPNLTAYSPAELTEYIREASASTPAPCNTESP